MTSIDDLNAEEARNWPMAKIVDLRSFIGTLFVISWGAGDHL
jgi:hypothetical protein